MIKAVVMSPNVALSHWAERRMSVDQVLSHTELPSPAAVIRAADEALENECAAVEMLTMTVEEEEEIELQAAVWASYGDCLHEQCTVEDQQAQFARIMKTIREEQAAKAFRFRRH
jgi:hypothetical protein